MNWFPRASSSANNRLKVTRNTTTRTITLTMERRDRHNRVHDRFQFTVTEGKFDKALLDAHIIAPWNREAS